MDATLILADSSAKDEQNGKAHALGIGWSWTATPTPPMALVVLIKTPWNETNEQHKLLIQLLDTDGHPVQIGTDPAGEPQFLKVEAEFEVGRPPGVPKGIVLQECLAVNIGPGINLQAGQIYEWRLEIDGEHKEGWSVSFWVRN